MIKYFPNIRLLAILTGAFLMLNSCSKNPVTGRKQISFMSESAEIRMGAESDPSVQAQFGIYDDPALQEYITQQGNAMAKISHRPNLKWTFRLVDSPVVNAFAVPGGYVYFTRGIMAYFNDEAQFVGVLGHEIGHVTARHGAQQQTTQILSQVGLLAAIIANPTLAEFALPLAQGVQLGLLANSRAHESQSDELGVEYSSKIGYDATYMADFFKSLDRLTDTGGEEIPNFMSTHPDPADRYQKVKQMATEYQKEHPGTYKENRDSYLRRIDGIVFGEDPLQGYVENQIFYHPVLKFEFPIPADWIYQNSPTQFIMATSDQKGMMAMTLSAQKDLNAAAQAEEESHQLTELKRETRTINGLPALLVLSNQVQQDPVTGKSVPVSRLMSAYIQYDNYIYVLHGVCEPNVFSRYQPSFQYTIEGFKKLTDPNKLNVKPERIKVIQNSKSQTLQQFFTSQNMTSSRFKELAILNGMELTDNVPSGMLIKIVTK